MRDGTWHRWRQALKWRPEAVILALAAIAVIWLLVVPMILLFLNSLRTGPPSFFGGPWTLRNYIVAFTHDFFYGALANTVIYSAVATLGSLVTAAIFAWLVERTDMPFRGAAWIAILLPIAMPGVIFALTWMLLLMPEIGMINVALRWFLEFFGLHLERGPLDIQSLWGIIFLGWLRGVSTIFLMIVGVFRMMDPSLEEAASLAGASPRRVFRRITLPLLAPALFAAGIYSFVDSMDSFEGPLVLGLAAGIFVLSTLIYFTTRFTVPFDYGLGAAYSVFFMAIMTFLTVFYLRMIRRAERFAVITGKGFRPTRYKLGKWRYAALGLFALYFILTILAPILVLVWASLLPYYVVPSFEALKMVSLDSYVTIIQNPRFTRGLINTLIIAIATGTLTMLVAFLISWVTVRTKYRTRFVLDGLTFVSFAIPGIVVALALVFVYLQPPFRYFGIYGTVWIIVLGLATQYLAFTTRATNAGLLQIHKELEEAALIAGASRFRTLWRITVRLLVASLVAGWVWVVAHATRAFGIPLVLSGRENEVLSVWLWLRWTDGFIPEASAIGVMLILITAVMGVAARQLLARGQLSGTRA
ncbi:MAG: iron ABC transporter permease [Deltaproteobacteria bacterium]|nr:iron ABC transporter permease [Deltaproteobacteria bacterium]